LAAVVGGVAGAASSDLLRWLISVCKPPLNWRVCFVADMNTRTNSAQYHFLYIYRWEEMV